MVELNLGLEKSVESQGISYRLESGKPDSGSLTLLSRGVCVWGGAEGESTHSHIFPSVVLKW